MCDIYEILSNLLMLHLELMKWAEFCAPFVVISVLFGFAYALHESVIRSEQLDKKRRATIRKQQKEIAAKDGAYKKLRRENAALRVRKVRSGRKLRRENAQLQQQLSVAEAKLAAKQRENGRHEDGEIEIRDPEEEVDVDIVAVLPCEFDADLDFPPLALADDLEDDEETPPVPVDRPEPEPEPALPDDDDEITFGHDSPPRNSTPPSPTPTLKDTSPSPGMDENAPQSVIESSSGPEDSSRLGRIVAVAYSKKARRMVHVRRSARLLSAGTGNMSVVGCQWYVRTVVSVMNLSSTHPTHSTPSSVSTDCKIRLLLLHQLSLARVLVGDVLVGLLVCWCVGVCVLVCWCVGVLVCWCVGVLVCWCVGVLVCWLSVCWLSVLSQNPGGTRTLSLCHQVWHGDFGLCAITKSWWHEDFVLVSSGMAWRLRSLCHLGRVP